jgi:Tfp pilus assembly protein PilE
LNKHHRLKHSGVTLLETMLATALILLGVIIGIQQYRKVIFNRHVAQIKNSVKLLTSALEQYYFTNCYWFLADPNSYDKPYSIAINSNPEILPVSSDPTNPTLQYYIMQPNLIDNPYSAKLHGISAYAYTIDTTGDFPILRVSTTFNVTPAIQNILAGQLKPTSHSGNQFTWSTTPGNTYLTTASLNPNLSYMQWLAAKYNIVRDSNSQQVAYQYVAYGARSGSGGQFNVCYYWQQPKWRCIVANNASRCDYQNKPS